MKIGIIVYSQTGHTLLVANELKKSLESKNKVDILEIKANRNNGIELTNIPKIDDYDSLVLATFTEAFSLCPVMREYLKQTSSLKSKKLALFVTEHFPYPWMGGNHSIRQMKDLCKLKGGITSVTGVINWSNKKRNLMISNLINKFTNYFNS